MTIQTQPGIGMSVKLNTSFEKTLERVLAALKSEGFGVLTEIDVKATLKTKLDVDFRPYKILGACNPPLAHRALEIAPEVGMLLPCNVTVSQEQDHCLVSIVHPLAMLGVLENPGLEPIARQAHEKLERVTQALQES